MKRFLLLTSLLLPTASFAKPIAVLSQSGGFCPGTCPSTAITIEDNGAVVATTTKKVPTPSVETRTLSFLGKEVMQALQKDIRSIKATEIIDLEEGQPICADIPQTLYTVIRGNQKIDIGYDRDCHKYRMADGQGVQLAEILRSSLDLYYYSQRN